MGINAKHYEPILQDIIAGQKPVFYKDPESGVYWFAPYRANWAFSSGRSSTSILCLENFEEKTAIGKLIKGYENIRYREDLVLRQNGTTKTVGKLTLVELVSNENEEAKTLLQKPLIAYFPAREYKYIQNFEDPRNAVFCVSKHTALLEGIVFPYISH